MAHELMFMQIYAIIHINAAVLLIYFFSFNVPLERWQGGAGKRDDGHARDLHDST